MKIENNCSAKFECPNFRSPQQIEPASSSPDYPEGGGGAVSSTYPLLSREHATHNSPRRMTLIHDFLIAIYTGQRLITLWRLCRGRARVDKAGLQDRSAATHPRTTSYPRAAPLEPHHDPDTSKMAVMKHSEEQRRTICFIIDLKGVVFQTILNCWETLIFCWVRLKISVKANTKYQTTIKKSIHQFIGLFKMERFHFLSLRGSMV